MRSTLRNTTLLTLLAGVACVGFATGCESSASARSSADLSRASAPATAFKPGLRAELIEMRQTDQDLRAEISKTPASERRELFLRILANNDKNVVRLELVVDTYGWPTISMVGKDGAEAAWLIAQHADQRPDFRERCLGLMQQAANQGEASKAHLAYLIDRVMVEVSQQQFYGTQFWDGPDGYGPVPIVDREGLEERRTAAGLVGFDDYRAAMEARRPGAALAESAPTPSDATASADPDN